MWADLNDDEIWLLGMFLRDDCAQKAVPEQYIFHHHFSLQLRQIFSSFQFRQVLLYEQFHLYVCMYVNTLQATILAEFTPDFFRWKLLATGQGDSNLKAFGSWDQVPKILENPKNPYLSS